MKKFHITATNFLSQTQLQHISALYQKCVKHDSVPIAYFAENNMNSIPSFPAFLLCYKESEDVLVGFLSAFFPDEITCQLYCFVHPSYRRQGIFDALEDQMFLQLDETEVETILYPVYHENHTAHEILTDRDYALAETEYSMSLSLCSYFPPSFSVCDADSLRVVIRSEKDTFLFEFFSKDVFLGQMHVYISGACYTIYSFEIKKENRGKHLGSFFLHYVITYLKGLAPQGQVLLQVTGSNLTALSLYRKFGFQIKESLDYYIL